MSGPEVLVLGGGLAGTAAAIVLARAGRHVALLEREAGPRHKVCGEFLSAEALELLAPLGVDPAGLGATAIRGVRLCSRQGVAETALPFPARSLTRRCLDDAMLHAAQTASVDVRRGTVAEALAAEANGWAATLGTGERLGAPQVILATGKHDLRGFPRPAGVQGDLVAMKMYLRLAPPQAAALAGHVELLLHPGGYTGLEPVEGSVANLCALVQRRVLARLGGRWESLLDHIRSSSAHARERLEGAVPLLDRPLAVSSIPYGFVRREPIAENLWAVGDQAAVIPSFTGDGMSMALFGGIRAAQSLLAGETSAAFQPELGRTLRPQVARATALSRALVYGPTCRLLTAAARMHPGALGWTALATRLPATALRAARHAVEC